MRHVAHTRTGPGPGLDAHQQARDGRCVWRAGAAATASHYLLLPAPGAGGQGRTHQCDVCGCQVGANAVCPDGGDATGPRDRRKCPPPLPPRRPAAPGRHRGVPYCPTSPRTSAPPTDGGWRGSYRASSRVRGADRGPDTAPTIASVVSRTRHLRQSPSLAPRSASRPMPPGRLPLPSWVCWDGRAGRRLGPSRPTLPTHLGRPGPAGQAARNSAAPLCSTRNSRT